MIQSVINRMANNSFLLKGWCVTIVSGLFAFASKDQDSNFVYIVYFPVIMFWFLDAYFLLVERKYRELYNKVRIQEENQIDFDMNPGKLTLASIIGVMGSITMLAFYGLMTLTAIAVTIITLKTA